MSNTQSAKRLRNWFISKIHHKLYGDVELTTGIWTYKPELIISIARETKLGYKVKTTSNEIFTIDWYDLDRYFERDRKRIEAFLESNAG